MAQSLSIMASGEHKVVISGIGGKFPECCNVQEFKEKLFSEENLLKSDGGRWNPATHEKPFFSGKIPEWNKFDLTFFGVPSKLAGNCDPMMGLMLERSFEAMVDAGVNPITFRGRNVSVISSTSISDAEILRVTDGVFLEGLGMVGHSRTMMANRISYCFNFTGPSFSFDSSWTSAMHGLETASTLVAQGVVEAALVVTCNLLFYNSIDTEYTDLNLLALDSKCSPFDAEAKGFARSESVAAFFIQRAENARRNYCTIVGVQTGYVGDRDCGFIEMNPQIENFFKDFYSNCKVNPTDVSYLEAGVFGDKNFDEEELNAVANTFCHNKKSLLIGSLQGNLGNSESTSGFVSLVKVIIALEGGIIPPTLNYNTPNPNVPGLVNGQLKPVTEPTQMPGDLAVVTCLNYCGNVSHVLVQGQSKVKDAAADSLPRLVILQARHEDGARAITDKLHSMPSDAEFLCMVNDVFKTPIPAYLWRAYTILPAENDKTAHNVKVHDPTKRPLWFVFSGMGSQWAGMGRDLLRFPVFATAIDKCHQVLRPRGLDIKHIITSEDPTIFDDILNCFVGIAAVQIGLVDILHTLGLTPDGMVGHSVGELGCAYADGCFTAEEMVLAAYARGKASLESDVIKGMMAAVGLGYQEIKDRLPPTIDVACHNSENSCTLSGPTEDVLQYVDQLKQDGVFAKAVSAGNIAYHSRYIKTIAPKLLAYLKESIPNPKPRSSRWVSSSVPETQWDQHDAKMSSAEYHTNNLLNPVLFEEACKHLPKDAILVEVAPHGLLQAILRRSVGSDVLSLSLTNRTVESNVQHLLKSIGQLHLNNVAVDVNALYPAVQYPVARGTPSLVDLVTWDHKENLYQVFSTHLKMLMNKGSAEKSIDVNPKTADYELWKDHCIEGQVVVPFSQLIMYPLKMILVAKRLNVDQTPILIENVTISDHVTVDDSGKSLLVTFSKASFTFEVSVESEDVTTARNILTGRLTETTGSSISLPECLEDIAEMEEVTEEEIYCLLAHFGCHIGPQFRTIRQIFIGESECVARVQWTGNLITFLDALFKIVVFLQTDEQQMLLQPSFFNKLTINTKFLNKLTLDSIVDVHYNYRCNSVVCQGVELLGLTLSPTTHSRSLSLQWTELKLQPYFDTTLSIEDFLSASLQLASDTDLSSWSSKPTAVKVLEVKENNDKPSVFSHLLTEALRSHTFISRGVVELDLCKAKELLALPGRQSYLLAGEYNLLAALVDSHLTLDNLYCLTYLCNNGTPSISQDLRPVLVYQSQAGKLALLKKVCSYGKMKVLEAAGGDWQGRLRQMVSEDSSGQPVAVVTRCLTPRQLLPYLDSLPYAHLLRTVFILDRNAPQFSLTSPLYCSQLALGLPVNILSAGVWSSLRTVGLDVASQHNNLDCLLKRSESGLDVACVGLNTTTFTLQEDQHEEPELKYVDYSGWMGGQRVMGVGQLDPVYNSLTADSALRWPVPADWSLVDAATVPLTYVLAYYCVLLKAKVQAGENVLVHAAMSPLGQAVVAITLQVGGNVFATVTKEEEVISLLKLFPSLNPSSVQVLGSQDLAVKVQKLTKGRGVEVIINCLRGRDMQSSVKIMGYDCRFLHLGNVRVEDRESIGMLVFLKRTSFYGVSLDNIASCDEDWKARLREALTTGIQQGLVTPTKRSSFSFKHQEEALHHLQTQNFIEKTVLVAKQEGQMQSLTTGFHCNPDHMILIAGTKTDLWLDVAEWLVRRGARRLIVLAEEEQLVGDHVRRFNKLINRHNNTIVITSLTRLDSEESAVYLFKEVLRMAIISSIFCVCMDENSSRVKSLDSVSRQLLPELQQFVSLLGEGAAVCESRALGGLPAVSVQSISPLQDPSHVLPYLSTILEDSNRPARFFKVKDTVGAAEKSDVSEINSFLPSSIEEVHTLGLQVSDRAGVSEVVTRSPGYCHTRHSLVPVFLVPGLSSYHLQPLFCQLIHPAFCCSLPVTVDSVDQFAHVLLQSVLQTQERGPYTLVGDSWSGAATLVLGCLLEARGQEVELFLVEGVPSLAQERVAALCERYTADLASSLLAATLSLSVEVTKKVCELKMWEEKMQLVLEHVEASQRGPVSRALTSLYSQVTALQNFRPSGILFQGNVTIVSRNDVQSSDLRKLSQLCFQTPKLVVTGDENHHEVLASFITTSVINENTAFAWKL